MASASGNIYIHRDGVEVAELSTGSWVMNDTAAPLFVIAATAGPTLRRRGFLIPPQTERRQPADTLTAASLTRNPPSHPTTRSARLPNAA